ncbi:hypothetical protein QZH41_016143 [Actinostola sp. cb2023]|nr:hypothetical protein QZH41_016143 [Actinostola sp. cb2023]
MIAHSLTAFKGTRGVADQMVNNYLLEKEIKQIQQQLQTGDAKDEVKQFSTNLSLSKPSILEVHFYVYVNVIIVGVNDAVIVSISVTAVNVVIVGVNDAVIVSISVLAVNVVIVGVNDPVIVSISVPAVNVIIVGVNDTVVVSIYVTAVNVVIVGVNDAVIVSISVTAVNVVIVGVNDPVIVSIYVTAVNVVIVGANDAVIVSISVTAVNVVIVRVNDAVIVSISVTAVNDVVLNHDDELVSFDVVALFTSIPTHVAVSAAKSRLDQDDSLRERTSLTSSDAAALLSFCLSSTEFCFNSKFYKQIHGTTMGSPISVVVADLVTEELESRALATFTNPPSLYGRYVDDTICVIQKDQINAFHQHLDCQDPNIKFTVERYSDDGLSFLDTLNKVLDDGTIDVSIFRKKTHTDRYLHFSSHHPPQHKAAVVRTLVHRTNKLLSKDCHKDKERTHIGRALAANGYPRQFIHRFSQDRKIAEKKSDTEERKGFALIPYVQGTTERIKRVLESHRIEVCVKPLTTLRQILSKPKDPLPKEKKTGVIYSIPCGECETFYFGETGRSLATRTSVLC